jgi:hypothetical protein
MLDASDRDRTGRVFDPGRGDGALCAESFSEFLYRFWIENEFRFKLSA